MWNKNKECGGSIRPIKLIPSTQSKQIYQQYLLKNPYIVLNSQLLYEALLQVFLYKCVAWIKECWNYYRSIVFHIYITGSVLSQNPLETVEKTLWAESQENEFHLNTKEFCRHHRYSFWLLWELLTKLVEFSRFSCQSYLFKGRKVWLFSLHQRLASVGKEMP